MIGGSFAATAVVVAGTLGLIGGLAGLLILQARRRGRDETEAEVSRHAHKARDSMDRVKPAGEHGTLERLRDGEF